MSIFLCLAQHLQRNKSPTALQQSVQSDSNAITQPLSNLGRHINSSEQQKTPFSNTASLQSSNQFNSSNIGPISNQFPPSHFGQPPLTNSSGSNPTHQVPNQLGQPPNKFQQNSTQFGQPPRPPSNSALQRPPIQSLDEPKPNPGGPTKASINGDSGQLQQSTGDNFWVVMPS